MRVFPENFAADYTDPNWPLNSAETYIDSLFPHPPIRHHTRRTDMRPTALPHREFAGRMAGRMI